MGAALEVVVALPPKHDSAGSTSTISSAVARPNGSGSKFLPPENRKPVLLEKKQMTFAHFAQNVRPRRKKSSLGRVLPDGARAVAWLTAALAGERVRGPLGLFCRAYWGELLRESSHTDLLEGDRPNHLSVCRVLAD